MLFWNVIYLNLAILTRYIYIASLSIFFCFLFLFKGAVATNYFLKAFNLEWLFKIENFALKT